MILSSEKSSRFVESISGLARGANFIVSSMEISAVVTTSPLVRREGIGSTVSVLGKEEARTNESKKVSEIIWHQQLRVWLPIVMICVILFDGKGCDV